MTGNQAKPDRTLIQTLRLAWSGGAERLRAIWRNRPARYIAILIILLGLIGDALPFEPYDWAQKSVSARINAQPYRGDAVIVEIDSRTLQGLKSPKFEDDHLADLVSQLAAARPKRIVIGRIRQRPPSQESSPKLLEALEQASPRPVMFVELVARKSSSFSWHLFNPKRADEFFEPPKVDAATAARVQVASEISSSTPFGAPWGLPPTVRIDNRDYPSLAQILAGIERPIFRKYEIDFSSDPATIPVINAVDVIGGRYDRTAVSGRQVLIYSTADITRDAIPTPFGRAASAAPIAILGAQTLIDGPPWMIRWIPAYLVAVIGIVAWFNSRSRWRRWIFISTFLVVLLSPILLERFLIFQATSNAAFLMIIVAAGRQWSKFRATLALARSAAETKSWFLAQASHDLRQPIHAIGMLAARLGQTELTPVQAELASKIDRSIEAANRMLQSLLDLATIESGSIEPRIAPVSVNTLFAEIDEQTRLIAERSGVDLRFVPCEATILTDRSLALAMLQNIVSNAIKYATGKRVLVGARRSGKTLALCVYDLGAGISEDDLRHVRKEFFRASSHKKGNVEGTGLGLAIVHRLANLMDLSFTLRSTPGKGTTGIIGGFRLSEADGASARIPDASAMRPLTGLKVLLLDDDEVALGATAALLEQWGCLVSAFDHFPEGRVDTDVILSDFDFGKGHTLADHKARIAELASAGKATIVISGHHPEAVARAMENESLLVLTKPVRPAELRSVLMANRSAKSAR